MDNLSIYTSLFNASVMGFAWRETLDNWTRFLNGAGQIVIAVNTSTDNTFTTVMDHVNEMSARPSNEVQYTVFQTDVPYANSRFDGLIKDEALKRCNRRYCSLLDIDEILPLGSRRGWERAMDYLDRDVLHDALLIPTLDLFHDEFHIKSMGYKFYLHRNDSNIGRGVVNYAERADGSIDITKSDTTEILYRDSKSLVRCAPIILPGTSDAQKLSVLAQGNLPYVWHTGWLSKQQRLRQSAFWAPVWSARDGTKVEKPLTETELDQTPYHPHLLPHWNTE